MKVNSYKAYENIDQFSPVFLFYDNSKKENYVYCSHNLTQFDNGNPVCIGVCINNVKTGQFASVAESGITNIRYYGDYPNSARDVYILKKYNNIEYTGYVSYLTTNVEPLTYEKSHIIKVGTVYPHNSYNDSLPQNQFAPRLMKVVINIKNQNYDHHNSHVIDQLPKINIDEKPFSMYAIGSLLKSGIENVESINAFTNVINTIDSDKYVYYNAINDYCEQVYYNIPFITLEGAETYVKRLTATMSSGQPVFDTYNPLRIVNNGALTSISLLQNPFGVGNFSLGDSLVKSHLYPYIDTSPSDNAAVVDSYYLSPAIGVYDIIKNTVNGVGFGVRFCPILDNYTYDVSYFNGITRTYNKQNSDGLILRLGLYKDEALAALLKAVYDKYLIIHNNYLSISTSTDTITENETNITSKTAQANELKTQLEQHLLNNNINNANMLMEQINDLQQEVSLLLQNSETLNNEINTNYTTSNSTNDEITSIENESYVYNVQKYVDTAHQQHGETTTNKATANTSFTNSETQSELLNDYQTSANTTLTDYTNAMYAERDLARASAGGSGTGTGDTGTGTGDTGTGTGDTGSGTGTGDTGTGTGDTGTGTGTGTGNSETPWIIGDHISTYDYVVGPTIYNGTNHSYAMNSDYIVSGDLTYNNEAVYVYDRNDNNSRVTIPPPDTNIRFFGQKLSISPNNTIAIGAYGVTYIYTIVDGTWTMTYQDTYTGSWFKDIAIDVNDTVVAVYMDTIFVYMVSEGVWSKTHTIDRDSINFVDTASEVYSMSAYDNNFVIGKYNSSNKIGSVTVLRYNDNDNTWSNQILTSGEDSVVKNFGLEVSIYQNYIVVVGLYNATFQVGNKAYIFKSPDNGITWPSLPTSTINTALLTDASVISDSPEPISDIAIYNNEIFVHTRYNSSTVGWRYAIYKYTTNDNGLTWNIVSTVYWYDNIYESGVGYLGTTMRVYNTDLLIRDAYIDSSRTKHMVIQSGIGAPGGSDRYADDGGTGDTGTGNSETPWIIGTHISDYTSKIDEFFYNNTDLIRGETYAMNSNYIATYVIKSDYTNSWVYVYDKTNTNLSPQIISNPYESSLNISPTKYYVKSFGATGVSISSNNTLVIGSDMASYIYTLDNGTWTMTYHDNTFVYDIDTRYYAGYLQRIDIDSNDTVVAIHVNQIVIVMVDGDTWSKTHVINRNSIGFTDVSMAYSMSAYDDNFVISQSHQVNLTDSDFNGLIMILHYNPNENTWDNQYLLSGDEGNVKAFGTKVVIYENYIAVMGIYGGAEHPNKIYIYKSTDNGITWPSTPTATIYDIKLHYDNSSPIDHWFFDFDMYNNEIFISTRYVAEGKSSYDYLIYKFNTTDNGSTWGITGTVYTDKSYGTVHVPLGSSMIAYNGDLLLHDALFGSTYLEVGLALIKGLATPGGSDSY